MKLGAAEGVLVKITMSTITSLVVGHIAGSPTSLADTEFKRTENETQSEVSDPFWPLKIIFYQWTS